MQPGSPRSFRFSQRMMDNWQTAYRQLQAIGMMATPLWTSIVLT